MKAKLSIFGLVLTLASVAFFAIYIWKNVHSLPQIELSPRLVLLAIGLAILQVLVAIASSEAWRQILKQIAPFSATRRATTAAFLKSQFAKYIPGNVAQHIGRVVLAKQAGISAKQTTLSITIEALWTIACAAAIVALFASQTLLADLGLRSGGSLSSFVLSAIALLLPVVGLKPILRLLRRKLPETVHADLDFKPMLIPIMASLSAYLASFAFLGFSLNVLANEFLNLEPIPFLHSLSICAFAWVAGFITPGSPAGIGIREAVLLVALAPIVGPEAASALAIAHRVLTAIGDSLGYAVGLGLAKRAIPRA